MKVGAIKKVEGIYLWRGITRREDTDSAGYLNAHTEIPAAMIAAVIAAVFQFTNALQLLLYHQPNCKAAEHDRHLHLQCQRSWQEQNISVWIGVSLAKIAVNDPWLLNLEGQRFT